MFVWLVVIELKCILDSTNSSAIKSAVEYLDTNGNYDSSSSSSSNSEESTLDYQTEDYLFNQTQISESEMHPLPQSTHVSNQSRRQRRLGSASILQQVNGSAETNGKYRRLSSEPGQDGVNHHGIIDHTRIGSAPVQSEFDISGQTHDNRFPWLRDKGIQCDFSDAEDSNMNSLQQQKTKRSQSSSAL